MVYWVEFQKMYGIRERAGETLTEARRYAARILKSGRVGYFAEIFTSKSGQIPYGAVRYIKNQLEWMQLYSVGPFYSYKMYANGRIKQGSGERV